MAKALVKKFDDALEHLFESRVHPLKLQVRKKQPGNAPKINKHKVERTIVKLQELAERILLDSNLFYWPDWHQKKQWHPKRGKGHGVPAKAKAFKAWYGKHVPYKNCVYAFFQGNRCLYVGRTLQGKGRPSSHFQKHWFGKTTRIDVYGFKGKSNVPQFECLATHYYDPAYAAKKPSARKYSARCPICIRKKAIRDDVKYIFRLR